MVPIIFTQVLAAANAAAIVNAQGTTGPVAMTLVTPAGVVLDAQRRVLITTAADERLNTFRVVGTNAAGSPIVENITGPNATTTQSNLDFKTVSSVTPLATTGGTVSVGTNGVGSSLWQIVNWNATPSNVGFQTELRSGAANYSVQYTYDDPNNLLAGLSYPLPFNDVTAVNATTTLQGNMTAPITAIRLLTNSGTGTLWFRMLQAGLASP